VINLGTWKDRIINFASKYLPIIAKKGLDLDGDVSEREFERRVWNQYYAIDRLISQLDEEDGVFKRRSYKWIMEKMEESKSALKQALIFPAKPPEI